MITYLLIGASLALIALFAPRKNVTLLTIHSTYSQQILGFIMITLLWPFIALGLTAVACYLSFEYIKLTTIRRKKHGRF